MLASGGYPGDDAITDFINISKKDRTAGWSHGDGWGVLWLYRGSIGIYKSLNPIWESFTGIPKDAEVYLLHSRYASVGSKKLANTHPIIYGSYAIAHNGTVNRDGFARALKGLGVPVDAGGDTDSELILKAFVHLGADIEAIRKIVAVASQFLDPEEPMLNAVFLNLENGEAYVINYYEEEHPHYVMSIARRGKVTIVASEPLNIGVEWSGIGRCSVMKISPVGEVDKLGHIC